MKQRSKLLTFFVTFAMIVSLFTMFAVDSSAAAVTGTEGLDVKVLDFANPDVYGMLTGDASRTGDGWGTHSGRNASTGKLDKTLTTTQGYLSITYDTSRANTGADKQVFDPNAAEAGKLGLTTTNAVPVYYQAKVNFVGATQYNTAYKYAVVDYRVDVLTADSYRFVWFTDSPWNTIPGTNTILKADAQIGSWRKTNVIELTDNDTGRLVKPMHVSLRFLTTGGTEDGSKFSVARVLFFKDKTAAEAYAAKAFPTETISYTTNMYEGHDMNTLDGVSPHGTPASYTVSTTTKYAGEGSIHVVPSTKWNGITITVPGDSVVKGTYAAVKFMMKDGDNSTILNQKRVRISLDGGSTWLVQNMVSLHSSDDWQQVTIIGNFYVDSTKSLLIDIYGGYNDPTKYPADANYENADGGDFYVDEVTLVPITGMSKNPSNVSVSVESLDYATLTATVKANIAPSVASQSVTWTATGATVTDNGDGTATVTLPSMTAKATVTATSTLDTSVSGSAEISMNDKIVWDMADNSTYMVYNKETHKGAMGDGNDAGYNANGEYLGYGVWTDGDTMKIGYQNVLQSYNKNTSSGGRNGHYMVKLQFHNGGYNRAYEYMVVEYRALNTSTAHVNMTYVSDNNAGAVNWTNIDVSGNWVMTDPKLIPEGLKNRWSGNYPAASTHGSLWFDDTDTDATYEIARVLFFKTEADAKAYKAAAAAGVSLADNIINTTVADFYANENTVTQLTANVYPMTGTQALTWTFADSADDAIADLTPDGKFKFTQFGTVTVRATAANGTYRDFVINAQIKPAPDANIVASAASVNIGECIDFGLVTYDTTDLAVTWYLNGAQVSSNTRIYSQTFNTAGSYTVSVVVTGKVNGDPVTFRDSVTVTVVDDTALSGWLVTYAMQQNVKNSTFTVTFLDGDGNVIEKQAVGYGKSATAPDYRDLLDYDESMMGWTVAFNKVTADITTQMIVEK